LQHPDTHRCLFGGASNHTGRQFGGALIRTGNQFGEFASLTRKQQRVSRFFCHYIIIIIIIVGKQAVHISQINKAVQRKYCRQRKRINIVTLVHYQQFSNVFGK